MRKRRLLFIPSDDTPQVNLTPLIDVVFVVLITFILIAPLLELDQISLAKNKPSKEIFSMTDSSSAITIHVYKNNEILVNRKRVPSKELLSCLRDLYKKHPNEVPRLFHDNAACFGTYQQIKNCIELAGFEKLDVILQPN